MKNKKIELSYRKSNNENIYLCTTEQSRTCREAKDKFLTHVLNDTKFRNLLIKSHGLDIFEASRLNAYFV